MIRKRIEKAFRIWLPTAAVCLWSIDAAAVPYCPSRDGRTISCNGCAKELDCDVNNSAAIVITGHNVTFDGGGHLISNSTGVGIAVLNTSGSTIRNLYIHNSASDGIYYFGSNSHRWGSSLTQVEIEAAKGYGIHHDAGYLLDIDECVVSFNTKGGIWSELSSFSSQYPISIVSTSIQGNGGHGVFVRNRGNSHFFNNGVIGNAQRGAYFLGASNSTVELSFFSENGIGLSIPSGSSSIQLWDNTGISNLTIDCAISSSVTTIGGTNSWGTSSPNCNPSP
jgi:Periplasmic copper-binding protein (NosD)